MRRHPDCESDGCRMQVRGIVCNDECEELKAVANHEAECRSTPENCIAIMQAMCREQQKLLHEQVAELVAKELISRGVKLP